MPTPCMNCVRFHYGACREPPKFCFVCGGINHIERYCPNQRHTIQRIPGEPLAGTIPWQEMHGLQHDPVLRAKVLQSLKASPGTAIHVNGVCIYRGYEKHFVNQEEPRGRDLDAQRGRRRSRSPGFGRLSRSPLRRNNGPMYNDPPMRGYRQRSPIRRDRRRTPSPYRHASPPPFYQPAFVPRSPRQTNGSNAIVFEARQKAAIGTGPQQHPLRESTGNVRVYVTPAKVQEEPQLYQPAVAQERMIEDPHFVLGIPKGAHDAEIISAHQERMREVEAERAMELDIDMELNNDYDESIRLLHAAKNQLLGYGRRERFSVQ